MIRIAGKMNSSAIFVIIHKLGKRSKNLIGKWTREVFILKRIHYNFLIILR